MARTALIFYFVVLRGNSQERDLEEREPTEQGAGDHSRQLEERDMQEVDVQAVVVPRYPNWLMELNGAMQGVPLYCRQGLANEVRYAIQETNHSQEQAQPVEHVCTCSFLEQQNRQVSCLIL